MIFEPSTILTVLLIGRPQADTLAYATLYLGLSWVIGRALGFRSGGLAPGYLTLLGAGALALYFVRGFSLPLSVFSPAVAIVAVLLVIAARFLLPPPTPRAGSSHPLYLPVVGTLWFCCWLMAALTPEPSAGYAFYQAWNPLYIEGAIARGFFPLPQDMPMGAGYLTNGLYYPADILGLGALGRLLLPLDSYAAVNGAAVAGSMAALGCLAWAIRRSGPALALYLLLGLIFFRWGTAFRLLVGNNWGDIGLVTGGATIAAMAVGHARRRAAACWAGYAAIFLVVGRNYGAAYAGIVLVGGFVACRARPWPAWIGLGALAALMAGKEILQVLRHGLFFPVANRMADHQRDPMVTGLGMLHDFGLLPNDAVLALPVGAGWALLALLLLLVWRRRGRWCWRSLTVVLAPLVLLAAPAAVELATGYRMSVHFSKLYAPAVTLFAWYPALLLAWSPMGRRSGRGLEIATLGLAALGLAAPLAWLTLRGPAVLEGYRDGNTDLRIIEQLAKDEAALKDVRSRPVIYFHYEPGVGLRYFLGGDLLSDYDFWSDPVEQAAREAVGLAELAARLGNASLYFPLGPKLTYAGYTRHDHWRRFEAEVAALVDGPPPPWAERIVRWRESLLIVPRTASGQGLDP